MVAFQAFHSPETPQSSLYVFVFCSHRSIRQLAGISRETQEIKHSALRKSYWTAWTLLIHPQQCWLFSEALCLGVGGPHSWHFLASLLSLQYCHVHGALYGTINEIPFFFLLRKALPILLEQFCSLIHLTRPLFPRYKPLCSSAFCSFHLAVEFWGVCEVLSPLLTEIPTQNWLLP